MVEKLSLPAKGARGGMIRFVAPMLVISPAVTVIIIAYVLRQQNGPNANLITGFVGGLMLVMGIFNLVLLKYLLKPADITINRTSIDVTPIAILGFGGGGTVNRSITEFDRVEIATIQGKGGPAYRVALRDKNGKDGDLVFDPPAKTDLHDYIARLGATLNLKVNDNAAN